MERKKIMECEWAENDKENKMEGVREERTKRRGKEKKSKV